MLIFEALTPVLALVLAGYLFRKYGFLTQQFWLNAESLTYYCLFPALILDRLISADLNSVALSPIILATVSYFILLAVFAWLINIRYLNLPHPSWTSFLQGSIRFNTFIALALVDSLFGPQMFAVSALAVGLFIAVVNIVTITAFNIEGKPSIVKLISNLICNPLILASLTGLAINLSALEIPKVMTDTLSVFGRAALPLAILAVGAGLQLKSLTHLSRELVYSSVIKLAIAPGLMGLLTLIFIKDKLTQDLLIVFTCVPTASAAYVLARKLGGDSTLMASIITFQTLLSFLSVTAVLFFIL